MIISLEQLNSFLATLMTLLHTMYLTGRKNHQLCNKPLKKGKTYVRLYNSILRMLSHLTHVKLKLQYTLLSACLLTSRLMFCTVLNQFVHRMSYLSLFALPLI